MFWVIHGSPTVWSWAYGTSQVSSALPQGRPTRDLTDAWVWKRAHPRMKNVLGLICPATLVDWHMIHSCSVYILKLPKQELHECLCNAEVHWQGSCMLLSHSYSWLLTKRNRSHNWYWSSLFTWILNTHICPAYISLSMLHLLLDYFLDVYNSFAAGKCFFA